MESLDNLARARLKANEKRMFAVKLVSGVAGALLSIGSFSNLYSENLNHQVEIITAFYLL
jgi:hypothetical protein